MMIKGCLTYMYFLSFTTYEMKKQSLSMINVYTLLYCTAIMVAR